ncbi:MAG: 2,3-bisphosphoglycerate-independent phosphoglycerate mutase [Planctomycetota bacterium]|nr:2,3-bisphosphoglycerate-independent phosphoglycerate mutase [Planctomycetota bacterium]
MRTITLTNTPLVMIIRDGWGENPNPDHDDFNAIKLASTPAADRIYQQWPTTLITTSGEDVGLPPGTMGNSEVGHQNIGAGRIVDQEIMRITKSIRDGSFAKNYELREAFDHAEQTGGYIHLLGLASDGQVHSDIQHLFALIDMAAELKIPAHRLFVHAITDGRDTPPFSGIGFIRDIEEKLKSAGVGRIASVLGRYYAMDRDHRWGRVALAYACLTGQPLRHHDEDTEGAGVRVYGSATEAVQRYYDQPTSENMKGDEFIVPSRIIPPDEDTRPSNIRAGDAVIFFNFRGDRPRELTKAFKLYDREWVAVRNGGFDRGRRLKNVHFCTLASYETGLPVRIAFEREERMRDILGAVIDELGLPQFRCAETEKFPHVTFFFNDYREEPFRNENRLLVPSPKEVATYDQKPEMSASEVCEGVRMRLSVEDCEPLIVVNLANGDMVGHTGNLEAAIRAVETVDECVGRIVEATLNRDGSVILFADHGNAEQMWDPDNDCPHTKHTTYDVPLTIIGRAFQDRRLRAGGRLGDVAPTALEMMSIEQPEAMTGRSLLALDEEEEQGAEAEEQAGATAKARAK